MMHVTFRLDRRYWVGAIVLALLSVPLLAAACSNAQAAPKKPSGPELLLAAIEEDTASWPRTYTGVVAEPGTLVALVVDQDGTAVAYLCDGEEVSTWFTGELKGGRGTLKGPSGARLVVEGIEGETLNGVTDLDGATIAFTAAAHAGGVNALQRAVDEQRDGRQVAGVIVHDGIARGARLVDGRLSATLKREGLIGNRPPPPVDGESTDVATASFAECQSFVNKVSYAQYTAMQAFAYGYSDAVQQLWWDEVDHWLDEFHENNCYVYYE